MIHDRLVDLRSDTVTQPTDEMRAMMADVPLGDDGYGEDPTVNRLEEMAADLLGMTEMTPLKFVKQYCNLGAAAIEALRAYGEDVREGRFPGKEQSYDA